MQKPDLRDHKSVGPKAELNNRCDSESVTHGWLACPAQLNAIMRSGVSAWLCRAPPSSALHFLLLWLPSCMAVQSFAVWYECLM
eukprot:741233-Pelagomonas_calceolata.AAC.2